MEHLEHLYMHTLSLLTWESIDGGELNLVDYWYNYVLNVYNNKVDITLFAL